MFYPTCRSESHSYITYHISMKVTHPSTAARQNTAVMESWVFSSIYPLCSDSHGFRDESPRTINHRDSNTSMIHPLCLHSHAIWWTTINKKNYPSTMFGRGTYADTLGWCLGTLRPFFVLLRQFSGGTWSAEFSRASGIATEKSGLQGVAAVR